MNGNLIIENTCIVTPRGHQSLKGSAMSNLFVIPNGCIIIQNGIIIYAGDREGRPLVSANDKYRVINADGNVTLPGFVDSHTHMVFGGFRPDEFEWRLKGDSYMSIMQRGGGIQSTVNATRRTSETDLINKTRWFIDKMSEMGITTVEAKSGYGLDFYTELKMLEVVGALNTEVDKKLEIVPTFMGAHAVPEEYKGETKAYVDYLIEILPQFKDKAKFCDVFCEKNVFEIDESRRLLEAARKLGFKLKLHADEIVTLGGGELSAELKAVSAEKTYTRR